MWWLQEQSFTLQFHKEFNFAEQVSKHLISFCLIFSIVIYLAWWNKDNIPISARIK